MDSRPEMPIGQTLQPSTETGSIPVAPEPRNTGAQSTTWRSTAGAIVGLVLAFLAITLMSL